MRHKTNYRADRGNSPFCHPGRYAQPVTAVGGPGKSGPSPQVEREGGYTPAGGALVTPVTVLVLRDPSEAAEPGECPAQRAAPARPRSAAVHYNSQKAARARSHSKLLSERRGARRER